MAIITLVDNEPPPGFKEWLNLERIEKMDSATIIFLTFLILVVISIFIWNRSIKRKMARSESETVTVNHPLLMSTISSEVDQEP